MTRFSIIKCYLDFANIITRGFSIIKCYLDFANIITRGFIAAKSEAQNLEHSFKDAWHRINRHRVYRTGRGKSFEMVSPGEFKGRITGSDGQGGFDFVTVVLSLVCVSHSSSLIIIYLFYFHAIFD